MMMLQTIDDSNRSDHYYLKPDDECYYLYEFTARQGPAYSPGNQFVFNFKISPIKREEVQYHYKLKAIKDAIEIYREIFSCNSDFCKAATFVPIPPSKTPDHPEYDDRMWKVVQGVCKDTNGDAFEMIIQNTCYDASHLVRDGGARMKPDELRKLYTIVGDKPRPIVILFDDVLTTGCHFRAAKSAIHDTYPTVRVIGIFLARRVISQPSIEVRK